VNRRDLLERLDESLWFQLSLAGQELFHSNMLYWLAKYRPKESAPVWELLAPGLGVPCRAAREEKNIDLAIECAAGTLILENKVFALPRGEQLQAYHDKLGLGPGTAWCILSLIPTGDVPLPWRTMSYSELLPALRAVSLPQGEAHMLTAYAGLIDLLVEVAAAFDPERDRDGHVFLRAEGFAPKDLGRASAVIQKLRMHRCAGWIQGRLPQDAPPVVPGFTRGLGLIEAFVTDKDGIEYGWQLQGEQFRLAIRTVANPRKHPDVFRRHSGILSEFKKANSHRYIEFSTPDDTSFNRGLSQKADWNKFGDTSNLNFIYKWRKVRPDIRWPDLVNLCVRQTESALAFVSELDARER
jgi:hypothetical protein